MKNTIVFIYNSYNDPLFQNLMLDYIKTVSFGSNVKFFLITFEQKAYRLSKEEELEEKEKLEKLNIFWYPLRYHSGSFLLIKKVWDLLSAFVLIIRLRVSYSISIIFCFANIAASFGLFYSKFLNLKLMVYSYEPHSEFLADLGIWNRGSLKYKILNKVEWKVGERADLIMTGTKWMVEELKKRGTRGKVLRAPTAVDPDKFYFSKGLREKVRVQSGLVDKQVFVYLGKFGGLYYEKEIPLLCSKILSEFPKAFFLILTQQEKKPINQIFLDYLNPSSFLITQATGYQEVRSYLSASDIGISLIPPRPSQKFRSPTKVAEYLLCGLPFITIRGVSEDDLYAEGENVGVVIDDVNSLKNENFDQLNELLKEDKRVLVDRCVKVGLEYRSKKRIDNFFAEIYDAQ